MSKPLAIDLFCGLGGFTEGCLAEGFDCVGFDIERHVYGEHRYPAQLVIQDVLTLHGRQFRKATLIVASPPCQEPSYRAMPWSRAKALNKIGPPHQFIALFDACFRIQREASEAAGHQIPLIVENVRGAQPWIGRARWNWGSFYLWGDVPALMPTRATFKSSGMNWSDRSKTGQDFTRIAGRQAMEGMKNAGGSWFGVCNGTTNENPQNARDMIALAGTKNGNDWFGSGADCSLQRQHGSKSPGRKFASAMIAKIPLPLSRHIAATFRP